MTLDAATTKSSELLSFKEKLDGRQLPRCADSCLQKIQLVASGGRCAGCPRFAQMFVKPTNLAYFRHFNHRVPIYNEGFSSVVSTGNVSRAKTCPRKSEHGSTYSANGDCQAKTRLCTCFSCWHGNDCFAEKIDYPAFSISPRVIYHKLTSTQHLTRLQSPSCSPLMKVTALRLGCTSLTRGFPCTYQTATCQREVLKFLRGPLAADCQTNNGSARLPIRYGESVIVFTAAAGWWTNSIKVVVSATIWISPELLGISLPQMKRSLHVPVY